MVPWLSWVGLLRTWVTNPHLLLCWCLLLWIVRESSCPHIPFEIGRSDGTSRISRVGIFNRDKRTQDNSEHQSGSNPDTQGDGWLFFFNSFSLQIKSFLQYFCVVFITKWLPWQPYITKPIINYELVIMATGFHDNHTKLFNFHQYISFYKNNIQLHFDTKCENYT